MVLGLCKKLIPCLSVKLKGDKILKILYFTGTGNCLSVAKRFNAELLSIMQMIKNNIYQIEDDTVGIV